MSGSVKVPAEWFARDDVEELGPEAAMLHLSALAHSAQQLTNGRISNRQLRRLYPTSEPVHKVVDTLVEAGWWEPVDDGWQIVDWHDFILSDTEVDKIRADQRTRSERYRRHKRGDHTMCDRCSAIRNSGGASRRDEHRDERRESPRESRPPNRTEPKVRGSEVGAGEADSAGLASLPEIDTPPAADASAMRAFLRASEPVKAAALAKARGELGEDSTEGARLARAAQIIGEGVA